MTHRVVTWHGEHRSLFYVVAPAAADAEDGTVIATFENLDDANRFRAAMEKDAEEGIELHIGRGTWRGRPVELMSREELIDAIAELSRLYNEALSGR